jgi:hypothetical protein
VAGSALHSGDEVAGAGTWTAAPIHAATEAMADLGRLLVRAPGTVVKADLEVGWTAANSGDPGER